ncbi:MAG: hypothetical protein DMG85_14310, partial [Acidobacteria bacterium]
RPKRVKERLQLPGYCVFKLKPLPRLGGDCLVQFAKPCKNAFDQRRIYRCSQYGYTSPNMRVLEILRS